MQNKIEITPKTTIEELSQSGLSIEEITELIKNMDIPTEQIKLNQKTIDELIKFVANRDAVSISILQRYLRVGFHTASEMIEWLQQHGVISSKRNSANMFDVNKNCKLLENK